MLVAFVVAFQLHVVSPRWNAFDSASVAWRAGAPAYQILLEESVVPRDSDPDHRIRIRVPGRPDFTVVDDRGPGRYVPVRAALQFADRRLIPPKLTDSARVLVLPVLGRGRTTILAIFGYGYASNPDELTLVGFDSTGYPGVLFRQDFDLVALTDLDHDGVSELIGRASLSQGYGKCSSTYDPYSVYRFTTTMLRYDRRLSRQYNEAHYVWAGPKTSETIEVQNCTPGKLKVVRHKQ